MLGLEFTWLIILSITVILLFLLKFYTSLTCGYYRGKDRMDGKTVIITGANGGIGKETTREIAKRGARVIMACRNLETGKQARDEIVQCSKNSNVILKKLDLTSQKSIRQFAEDVLKTEPRLDVLIHNAASGETKFKKTEDGLEINMATNHFGPFLLTHLLIDLLKESAPSRIVLVASSFYILSTLNLNNMNPSSSWCPGYYYYQSKYANISFALELARRLKGTQVTANCLHPGVVNTNIFRHLIFPLNIFATLILKGLFKSPQQGCQTSLKIACSEELEGVTGKYYVDCAEGSLSKDARDEVKAKKLWELCEKLVNLKPTDPVI